VRFCALVFATLTLWAAVAAGQNRPAPSRTPWGDPDLQGTWPGGPVFVVPFERAPEFGTRATLTAEELARRNAQVDRQLAAAAQGNFWPELGHGPAQTSLIVEPENGRLPPMTADGGRRAQEWLVRRTTSIEFRVPTISGPTTAALREACSAPHFPMTMAPACRSTRHREWWSSVTRWFTRPV